MFPLSEKIEYKPNHFATVQQILEYVYPILTSERKQKIERVAAGRCFEVSVVLEGIYDRGNISAVMRTAEGLGFADFHIIEKFEKFKEANRVTQGADKWVEVKKWKSTKEYIDFEIGRAHV